MITDREISIAKNTAQELRNKAKTDHDSNTGYSLKCRRELEEKAEIIEKLSAHCLIYEKALTNLANNPCLDPEGNARIAEEALEGK